MKALKRPYVFYITSFDRSNGIRVMMILSEKLSELGYDVFYYVQDPSNWSKAHRERITEIDAVLRESGIVVYPEIVAGNPLRFRHIARLALFYPGRNGGMRHFHKSEMVFAYRPEFLPGARVLTIPWIDKSLFYDSGCERTTDYCFVYKGGRWCDPAELRGLKTITMKWPATREELAELLRHTRTLYSFDNCSALLDEALCCGADVRVVTRDGFKPYISDHAQVEAAFPAQLDEFVAVTQTTVYTGRIQSKYLWFYWCYAVWRYWVKPLFVKPK